jgi:PAS domain S-box-containing protein
VTVRSWLRTAGLARLALPALIVLLAVGGFLISHATIRADRQAAAERRVELESVRAGGVLARARAYVAGLATVLSGEPRPSEAAFTRLAVATAASVGLVDAMWVERRPGNRLVAVYASRTRPLLQPGADVTRWPALSGAIRDRTNVFAVTATGPGTLGGDAGFYLLQAAAFGPTRLGFLVLFVPRGWLTASLEDDPRHLAISLDGRRFEGRLEGEPAAGATFFTLARRWHIDVENEPASGLQTLLPWLALGWPLAAALLVYLMTHAILRRRRAERDLARMFNLSLDMLSITGFDGRFRRVNPAFEKTLGFTSEELLSRPFIEFVHPDDRPATVEAFAGLLDGADVLHFENRYLCADGSARWLQWSSRPLPAEGVTYNVAKDITESKRLVEEQAALRRVATLVARRAAPSAVFAAVCDEVGALLEADDTALIRYEADGGALVVAGALAGTRLEAEPERAAAEALAGELRFGSAVDAPIVVEGRLWGVIIAAWAEAGRPSADAEVRIAQFTELVASAIANAESRTQLAQSRARVIDAADAERRRVVRDLHDGAQQEIVNAVLTLKLAREAFRSGGAATETLVGTALEHAEQAIGDLRELAHGIRPIALTRGGLRDAVEQLTSRLPLPVDVDIEVERLPATIEANAYFAISETLMNVVKHASAASASVAARVEADSLHIEVRDDGVGGARPGRGTGLVGLKDRVETLGGSMDLQSPAGEGTRVRLRIPVDA